MQFNVAQLLKESIGAVRRYELIENIDNLDPELQPLSRLVGVLKLLRTNSGILATGDFTVVVQASCRRCLEPVEKVVEFSLEESFRPLTEVDTGRFIHPLEFEGSEDDLADAALLIDDHHILDISEVMRQNIWLAMPMVPGCIWPDLDTCPNFLLRLQEMEEVHSDLVEVSGEGSAPAVDPRWEALLLLQEQMGEDE